MTTTHIHLFQGLSSIRTRAAVKRGVMAGSALITASIVGLSPLSAIAQVDSTSSTSAPMTTDERPTPNAGSADLRTEPANTSLTQLVNLQVPSMPIDEAEEEVNIQVPRVFERGERFEDSGPAQANRVEFLLD